jgi:tRNA(fMet)-specific endonuclease VapC
VNFLLDTKTCVAMINGKPGSVRTRLQEVTAEGATVFVPSIVILDLWYEVAKSSRPRVNRQRLKTFLAGPITVLAFDEQDAEIAGRLRAALETAGKSIGAYDLLTAGQALRYKLALVTANVSEFTDLHGLAWEDWSKR